MGAAVLAGLTSDVLDTKNTLTEIVGEVQSNPLVHAQIFAFGNAINASRARSTKAPLVFQPAARKSQMRCLSMLALLIGMIGFLTSLVLLTWPPWIIYQDTHVQLRVPWVIHQDTHVPTKLDMPFAPEAPRTDRQPKMGEPSSPNPQAAPTGPAREK